ncbi:MAG: RNA polymerase sigma factor RpoH [Alphaproteobacteria bacterium]|nr:RNA polymerase sigma factor RpoH [Alphaproteobacteria bacterium]
MNLVTMRHDNGLARYADEVRKFPMLAADEERALSARWRDHRDQEAVRRLVGSHLRLVMKIARGFSGYGLPLEDLVAEGNLGLMQAVEKFDPGRGFRLATYAIWWIRATIQEYVLHNWSLVKMGTTAAQKKLFFNLRTLKGRMRELAEGDLSPATVKVIAIELGVSEVDVIDMNRRLKGDRSLNIPIGEEGDAELQDLLADEAPNQETILAEAEQRHQRQLLLNQALDRLSDRERHILTERRLKEDPPTLEELSVHYGVSRERVRQIEERALQKLEKAVRGLAADQSMVPAAA